MYVTLTNRDTLPAANIPYTCEFKAIDYYSKINVSKIDFTVGCMDSA